MPQLLGLRIENFKSLAQVSLGQTGYGQGTALPSLSCFIGPNGSGKSSLLDAFGFLADCLREGVEGACDKPQRGGFLKLRTQGRTGPVRFELYYRENLQARPITYSFAVDEIHGVPAVVEETLRQRTLFLQLERGKGRVWAGEGAEDEERAKSLEIELDDVGRLGITTLGQLKEHPRIVGLRSYIESWYLSYFTPDAARKLPSAGAQKHLDLTGENLGNVVQYMERTHPERFRSVLDRIARKIPGIRSIATEMSPDGRLLLRFNEQGYIDPFYQQSMSDGTLKMFAYLLLLEDPEPNPFIGIEEPENGLYHKLLDGLAREFIRHAEQSRGETQILVTTHSPYFVDALKPEQVWLMEKNEQGYTEVKRTADMPIIVEMTKEEIPLGSLWYSNHFEERFPN
ncbi:MAG TPA: AAA family ATPase [Thermoanaerobaculia bacterium]